MSYSAPRSRRLEAAVAAVLVSIAVLAGCGASTSAVKSSDSGASSTTVSKATTTDAPVTTDAPSTTDAPTTTAEETTTTERSTGGAWPESAKEQFLKSCEGGDSSKAPICECSLRALEPQISVAQLMEAGSSGSLPDDLQEKITKAATECAVDPTSH